MAHEFLQVTLGRFEEEVKMISHEHIPQDFDSVNLLGFFQEEKEGSAVDIIDKNGLPGIASASHVIICICKLNPQRPGHNFNLYPKPVLLSTIKI
jgi:hypothetical protein